MIESLKLSGKIMHLNYATNCGELIPKAKAKGKE